MADKTTPQKKLGRFSTFSQFHWVAGLIVSVVLAHFFALIVVGATNQWVLLILLMIVCLLLAAAVGFAVRVTSKVSPVHTFITALVCAGLGANVVARMGGAGFDDFAWDLLGAYATSPLTGLAIFYGLVAALVATAGRRS